MINFKTESFEGTLYDLIETCNGDLRRRKTSFTNQHEWLLGQYDHTPNLLPIRKGCGHSARGSLIEAGQRTFLVADNEPLASIYKAALEGGRFDGTMEELLRRGDIAASWKCDTAEQLGLSFKGVTSTYRKNGLKLAHIFDAAKGMEAVADRDEQLRLRYVRTLSVLNVFLFPNHRSSQWALIEGQSPISQDLAEDDLVRAVALGFVMSTLELPVEVWRIFRAGIAPIDVRVPDNWEEVARRIILRISPRSVTDAIAPLRSATRVAASNARRAPAEFSIRNHPADAQDVRSAIKLLRAWLDANPHVAQLDGSTVRSSNPSPWLHLRIDGYVGDGIFVSRYGPVFDGSDYNGVVNFHGDAPVEALRDFVDAADEAESIQDVLVPSATYESRSLPGRMRTIKPKFALKAYESGVNGFFLYHDRHPGKAVR